MENVIYDKETMKWFELHPDAETTVQNCEYCGLWYKPILGHKCKVHKKVKCKDCEHLRIDKPDAWNEGHAYCLKYDLSTMLVGKQYQKKIDSLECWEECNNEARS